MDNSPIVIRMLSAAESVPGQGVGSAYAELLPLLSGSSALKVVFSGKADIYHVHTVNPSFRLKMGKKKLSVMSVHFIPTTLDGSLSMPKWLFKIFKKYVLSTYRKAKYLHVVNPIFIDKLAELGFDKSRISYIPNYVSPSFREGLTEDDRLAYRKELGIDENRFVVLGVGQTQTRKGIMDFLKVAAENPEMMFVWAGGFSFGKMTDGYKEIKQAMDNPPENVRFLGIVKREEMGKIYKMADVFFLPSFDELFPMTILEAASIKMPILLRDLSVYEPILGASCLYGKGVDDFSATLRKLASDSLFFENCVKSSCGIAERYSANSVLAEWERFYRSIYEKGQ